LPRGLDGLGLIFELKHPYSIAIRIELHVLQLGRDVEKGLRAEVAEFTMVGSNMSERMMAALMRHEEPPIGHGFGHGHGADHDDRLAVFIDRGHRLLRQFRQKVGRDRAERIINGGKPELASLGVAAKQPDTKDSSQDQDRTTHSGPPAALSRFP
jgi:hypothetical protein